MIDILEGLELQDYDNVLPFSDVTIKDDILDEHWLKDVFMVGEDELIEPDKYNRYFTSAQFKFTDTTMGGNTACNARPQYTRYCDIRASGMMMGRSPVTTKSTGNHGMGIYYSEAHDDNIQKIYMSFGVPEFNGLFEFFTRAIDYKTAVIANTGRSPLAYNAGAVLGAVAIFIAFPIVSIAIWTLRGISKLFLGNGGFNYYYLKPTMPMFWGSVNSIVTQLSTEMGILVPYMMEDGSTADKLGNVMKFNQIDLNAIKDLLPGVITQNNYIDVYAIVNRAQMLANERMAKEIELYDSGLLNRENFLGYLKTKYTKKTNAGLHDLLNETMSLNKAFGYRDPKDEEEDITPVSTENVKELYTPDEEGRIPKTPKEMKDGDDWLEDYTSYFDAVMRGGGGHVVFQVEKIANVTETFNNSIKEIPTAGIVKSVANKGRDVRFSLGGGNIVDGMGDVMGYAKDMLAGSLDSLSFGLSNVLTTMFGNAYMDIPHMFDDSTVELPAIVYKARLVSPYNNPFSQLQNIYIPLGMLLAGTLPLSAGEAGYTSPYLCNAFVKGISNIKLGMITNLTITRGVSNLAFSKNGRALAIDVTFTITDFSKIMTAPVNTGAFGAFKMSMNEDALLTRYLSVLGSRDLHTNLYNTPKMKMRLSNLTAGKDTILSPSFNAVRDGDILKGIFGGFVSNTNLNQLDTND